jgi:hypothetical protein
MLRITVEYMYNEGHDDTDRYQKAFIYVMSGRSFMRA